MVSNKCWNTKFSRYFFSRRSKFMRTKFFWKRSQNKHAKKKHFFFKKLIKRRNLFYRWWVLLAGFRIPYKLNSMRIFWKKRIFWLRFSGLFFLSQRRVRFGIDWTYWYSFWAVHRILNCSNRCFSLNNASTGDGLALQTAAWFGCGLANGFTKPPLLFKQLGIVKRHQHFAITKTGSTRSTFMTFFNFRLSWLSSDKGWDFIRMLDERRRVFQANAFVWLFTRFLHSLVQPFSFVPVKRSAFLGKEKQPLRILFHLFSCLGLNFDAKSGSVACFINKFVHGKKDILVNLSGLKYYRKFKLRFFDLRAKEWDRLSSVSRLQTSTVLQRDFKILWHNQPHWAFKLKSRLQSLIGIPHLMRIPTIRYWALRDYIFRLQSKRYYRFYRGDHLFSRMVDKNASRQQISFLRRFEQVPFFLQRYRSRNTFYSRRLFSAFMCLSPRNQCGLRKSFVRFFTGGWRRSALHFVLSMWVLKVRAEESLRKKRDLLKMITISSYAMFRFKKPYFDSVAPHEDLSVAFTELKRNTRSTLLRSRRHKLHFWFLRKKRFLLNKAVNNQEEKPVYFELTQKKPYKKHLTVNKDGLELSRLVNLFSKQTAVLRFTWKRLCFLPLLVAHIVLRFFNLHFYRSIKLQKFFSRSVYKGLFQTRRLPALRVNKLYNRWIWRSKNSNKNFVVPRKRRPGATIKPIFVPRLFRNTVPLSLLLLKRVLLKIFRIRSFAVNKWIASSLNFFTLRPVKLIDERFPADRLNSSISERFQRSIASFRSQTIRHLKRTERKNSFSFWFLAVKLLILKSKTPRNALSINNKPAHFLYDWKRRLIFFKVRRAMKFLKQNTKLQNHLRLFFSKAWLSSFNVKKSFRFLQRFVLKTYKVLYVAQLRRKHRFFFRKRRQRAKRNYLKTSSRKKKNWKKSLFLLHTSRLFTLRRRLQKFVKIKLFASKFKLRLFAVWQPFISVSVRRDFLSMRRVYLLIEQTMKKHFNSFVELDSSWRAFFCLNGVFSPSRVTRYFFIKKSFRFSKKLFNRRKKHEYQRKFSVLRLRSFKWGQRFRRFVSRRFFFQRKAVYYNSTNSTIVRWRTSDSNNTLARGLLLDYALPAPFFVGFGGILITKTVNRFQADVDYFSSSFLFFFIKIAYLLYFHENMVYSAFFLDYVWALNSVRVLANMDFVKTFFYSLNDTALTHFFFLYKFVCKKNNVAFLFPTAVYGRGDLDSSAFLKQVYVVGSLVKKKRWHCSFKHSIETFSNLNSWVFGRFWDVDFLDVFSFLKRKSNNLTLVFLSRSRFKDFRRFLLLRSLLLNNDTVVLNYKLKGLLSTRCYYVRRFNRNRSQFLYRLRKMLKNKFVSSKKAFFTRNRLVVGSVGWLRLRNVTLSCFSSQQPNVLAFLIFISCFFFEQFSCIIGSLSLCRIDRWWTGLHYDLAMGLYFTTLIREVATGLIHQIAIKIGKFLFTVSTTILSLETPVLLENKVPYKLKDFKNGSKWFVLEKDSRVIKEGVWSKKKTGKKHLRRLHVNQKKLYPVMRNYIFSSRREGFTIDITNYLLNFFKWQVQHRRLKHSLLFFFRNYCFADAFFHDLSSLPFTEATKSYGRENFVSNTFVFSRSSEWMKKLWLNTEFRYPLWYRFQRRFNALMKNIKRVFKRPRNGLLDSVRKETSYGSQFASSRSVISNSCEKSSSLYVSRLRDVFRLARGYRLFSMRKIPLFEHLFEPTFVSFEKREKNRFFLFTMFKSKRWSICLNNKTSKYFVTDSKLKKTPFKLVKVKKADVVKKLHSNTEGSRRRRSFYKLQKFAFRFLEANFKHLTKIFRDTSRTNRDFEKNSIAFYNNIAFLVYRLGYMGTLSASIMAVKRNWFCCDFVPVSSFDSLIAFGSTVTLYPSAEVLSFYIWYRSFFIQELTKKTTSSQQYTTSYKPFFIFSIRKKYRIQFINSKFELLRPFVMKSLKLFRSEV